MKEKERAGAGPGSGGETEGLQDAGPGTSFQSAVLRPLGSVCLRGGSRRVLGCTALPRCPRLFQLQSFLRAVDKSVQRSLRDAFSLSQFYLWQKEKGTSLGSQPALSHRLRAIEIG